MLNVMEILKGRLIRGDMKGRERGRGMDKGEVVSLGIVNERE